MTTASSAGPGDIRPEAAPAEPRSVTITTTPEGAEIIRLSLACHAQGIKPWADMPNEREEPARRSLARVRAVQADVAAALIAAGWTPPPTTHGV